MTTIQWFEHIPRQMLWGVAALLFSTSLLGGCSQDDELSGGGNCSEAVSFKAGINSASALAIRTTNDGGNWTTSDKVGIFMLTTGGNITTPTNLLAANEQYNVDDATTGTLSPNSGTPIYYPQSGNVDFVAYYPFTNATGTGAGGITTKYQYNISVAGQISEATQNALDVLYAKATNNSAGYAKSPSAPVNLVFSHVLGKVTFNVMLSDELDGLTGKDVTAAHFTGMPVTATLDLQDGTLTAGTDLTKAINALKGDNSTSIFVTTFSAILVPQTTPNVYSGRMAVFTVGGVQYTWEISNYTTFAAATHYHYPVTVKKTGIEVGTPTISQWKKHDNGTGKSDFVVMHRPSVAGL